MAIIRFRSDPTTIQRFRADSYDVGSPPTGKSWQWINEDDLQIFLLSAWLPVEAERLPGQWDQIMWGTRNIVAINGSILVERDQELTNKAYEEVRAKADQNIQDCLDRMAKIVTDAGYSPLGIYARTSRGYYDGQEDQSGPDGEGAGGSGGELEAPEGGGSAEPGHGSELADDASAGGEAGESGSAPEPAVAAAPDIEPVQPRDGKRPRR